MIVIGASIKNLCLFPTDANQAYIHNEENFQRAFFVKTCKKFALKREKNLKLKKLLYGLAESGYYWGRTLW